MSHLSTLFFDKPLNAHTLMQAIARTNRVHVVKNSGVVADYCGILKHLSKALATFAGTTPTGGGDTESQLQAPRHSAPSTATPDTV